MKYYPEQLCKMNFLAIDLETANKKRNRAKTTASQNVGLRKNNLT